MVQSKVTLKDKKNYNDASEDYKQYSKNVLSTRYWGNILIECEKGKIGTNPYF
jgi:hypothetical protein